MPPDAATQIDRLIALAEREPHEGDPPGLSDFLRIYFGDVHPEHLADRPPRALLEIARRHRRLIECRPPRGALVDVYAPEYAASARTRAVATVAADMPFLVDTVTMAVRDAGGAIDWVLHPVLRIRRDDDGALISVPGPADDESYGDEESLIEVQFATGPGFDEGDLAKRLKRRLDDLRVVVGDWRPMLERVDRTVEDLAHAGGVDSEERSEAEAFLRWLADDRFTFLGYRERRVVPEHGDERLAAVPGTSLGLLREDRPGLDPHGYVAPAAELDKYALSPRLVVVTKSNTRAWIHHAEFMDVVVVKRLDRDGNVIGAHRFLGLFSGEAYAASPRRIPMLRRKVRDIVERAALRPRSHGAKNLHYVLETFPRDELFQGSEDELFETVMGVVALRESQRLRLFMRRDRYGRFFSCLVYVPRERYSVPMRRRLGECLADLLNGRARESSTQFLRDALVRVHYIVATSPGTEARLSVAEIEARLLAALRTWRDRFEAALDEEEPAEAQALECYADAFPTAYTERYSADDAVADARILETLDAGDAPRLRLLCDNAGTVRLKLYGRGPETALAAVLPVLENFGLHVVSQRPFTVLAAARPAAWVHEFAARQLDGDAAPDVDAAARVEVAFVNIWAGKAENDGLNRLVLNAGLDSRSVALVRTIARYLLQTQLPFSQHYVDSQIAGHPAIAAALVKLFHARFRPGVGDRPAREQALADTIHAELDGVASPDADRVLRAVLDVVQAALRSNYFQTDADGGYKPYVSVKLDPTNLPELPEPRPMFETFVYAPSVEGVHLRGGRVARGGLRWSDRREDFRTEVLGLMKAQMVKNAVIVPVGAKGGFVVKGGDDHEDRDARRRRGVAAYRTFVRGLLDITDNYSGDGVVPPAEVVRHDGDDPYLVVAADKGTASFSDIANELSHEYGFWLDDAFASGGSAGYDHKAMGITARGAWVAVERHFRELGQDVDVQDFTAVGIGDMGGDVFGNGMLLSRHIRLVAAFNHRHIFIDPDPDPEIAYGERRRLFDAASGWDGYDTEKLSPGGGVFRRDQKSIRLSAQARKALDVDREVLTPTGLIHEILKAPVDLLWNGGIGTYVKARHESHADVDDRANDALRVNGHELRCKVVGEGGNLGMTQAGRIEYALAGGRLNTDAIDNSGGVDSSDLEVNIKIALNAAEADGRLARDERNRLLADMTEPVAELVLRSNYLQTQLISVLESDAATRLDEQVHFIRTLEREGLLDRALEGLPDEEEIENRMRQGQGLTRPELAVLVSYAKIALFSDLLDSGLPDEPFLERALLNGFPPAMRERYRDYICGHRLRREIVATLVTNQAVDRMGVSLFHRLAAENGVTRPDAIRAFLLAAETFDAESLWERIEALDGRLPAAVQYRLLKRVAGLVKHAMVWLIARPAWLEAMHEWLERFCDGARHLLAYLPEYLAGGYLAGHDAAVATLAEAGVPGDLARALAAVQSAGGVLDILLIAHGSDEDLGTIANLYFQVGDRLGLPWLQSAIQDLAAEGRWQALARASLRDDCYRAHRRIVQNVLAQAGPDPGTRIRNWREARGGQVEFVRQRLADLETGEAPTFAHLAVAVRDLGRLGAPRNHDG